MNYLFFLIILLVPVGLASAETGKDYDSIINQDGSVTWTSHYDRVWDGNSWENYILTNDASQLKFNSAEISFVYDKTNCDFKLYDIGTNNLAINSYKFDLAVNSIPIPLPVCNVVGLDSTQNSISFTMDNREFKTLFVLDSVRGMEWTHEVENKAGTVTITEICKDCVVDSIDGNRIDFGSYTLDTKNEVHNTVKATKPDRGDYIVQFEKTITDKEKLVIDPTFSSNNPTIDARLHDTGNNSSCDANALTRTDATNDIFALKDTIISADDCERGFFEWDITSIPDGSVILNTLFKFDISGVTNPINCDFTPIMTASPTSATNANLWTDIGDGTPYLNNDATCTVAGNNISIDLGASADLDVVTRLAGNWFAVGFKLDNEVLDATAHYSAIVAEEDATATPKPTLEITYVASAIPLVIAQIRPTSIDLSWSYPGSQYGIAQGYQVLKTTPWGIPSSIVINSTNSTGTTYTVPSLTGSTQYSFRVSMWKTTGGINATSNIVDTTTDFDPTASFTPGTLNLTASGIDVRTFKFERDDIDATSLWLNVTYPNTFNTTCNFYYKFAMTNDTYTNLADVAINANEDEAAFKFLGINNEIVDVNCYDTPTNTTGQYLITQTHFPFQDQLDNFRNGTYGTQGQFGAFDFITIIGIMVSMMGFNRVNAIVGVIFCAIVIGVLSFFGIIQWYSTLTAVFAILIFWVWSTHRKDD